MKGNINLNEATDPPETTTFPATVVTPRALRIVSLVSLIMAVAMLGWAGVTSMRLLGFRKIFEDFDTSLPDITLFALRAGPWLLAFCCLLIIGLVVKETLMGDKGVTLLINVGAMAVAMGLWFFFAQAMLLPMVTLIQSVQR